MNGFLDYASFLVRIWTEFGFDEDEQVPRWQAEVESIQSGNTWRFDDFHDMAGFLQKALPGEDDQLHTNS